MDLVKVTYKVGNDDRQEIVEPNSDRFMELVQQGVENVVPAAIDAVAGTISKVKKIYYRENSGKKTQEIGYSTKQNKIKILDFTGFKIKDVPIILSETEEFGDLLAVDLDDNILTIYKPEEAKNIVYAIKHVQATNQDLIDSLNKDIYESNQNGENEGEKASLKVGQDVVQENFKTTEVENTQNSTDNEDGNQPNEGVGSYTPVI